MATVTVRYVVRDVDAAIDFYCVHLGFEMQMHPSPTFATVRRGDLRLALSTPGSPSGGGRAVPDGTVPEPGGWNRIWLQVDDLASRTAELRAAGVRIRGDIVTGLGGKSVLVEDPSGNLVELVEPNRANARRDAGVTAYDLIPVGHVESKLTSIEEAPRQGDLGAPNAWLVFDAAVGEAIRSLSVGEEILVITWFDRARRDVLACVPGSNPTGPELGVFSTRSPERPNPLGLHRVPILEVDGTRIRVGDMEALDGTPIVDVKPVLDRTRER